MLSRDRIGALFMLAFSVGYGALTFDIPLLPFQRNMAFTAKTMPEALSILGIVLSLALILRPGPDSGPSIKGFNWTSVATFCVLMVLYGFTIRPAGFLIATSLFLIGGFLILGERRPVVILGASIPVVVLFWTLMTQALEVYVAPLPAFLGG